MIHVPSAFQHWSTWAPLLVVLCLAVFAFLEFARVARAVRRAVQENDKALDQSLAVAVQPPKGPSRTTGRQLLSRLGRILQRQPQSEGSRWIVSGTQADVESIYVEACDDALNGSGGWSQFFIGVGHSLTGVALVFTFALIAWVLVTEVPAAIQGVAQSGNAQASQSGTDALQRAVGLMGAKFVVSALGLFLALLFRGFTSLKRDEIVSGVEASLSRHRDLFVVAEAQRGEMLRSDLRRAQEELQQSLASSTDVVTQRLDQLASIEVSVKDMGNEVKAHLGSLMKQHIADQICEAVADLRVFVDQIVQRLESSLTESFTHLATDGISKLTSTLAAIQETIERQTKSDVEKLIVQMREMLSGGFESESRQMTQAMTSLKDVLPRLEGQLRGLTEDMAREMRARAEDGQRAQAELGRQVEGLVAASRQSQAAMDELLLRIGRVAEESTGALHRKLSSSGEALIERFLSASEAGVNNLRTEFGRLIEMASENVSGFSREVSGTRDDLAGARALLQEALGDLRAMTIELRDGVDGTRTGLAAAERTANTFSGAGNVIHEAARRSQDAVRDLGERLGQESELVSKHGALATQIQELLVPALERMFVGYTEAMEEQARQLHDSWQQLAERVKQTVDACGAGLQEGVEQFADQVQILQKQLDRPDGKR